MEQKKGDGVADEILGWNFMLPRFIIFPLVRNDLG